MLRLVAVAPASFAPLTLLKPDAGLAVTIVEDARTLRAAMPDADVLLVHPRLGAMVREAWAARGNLRWIHDLAAGVDTLLFDELCASDVIVTNGRGLFADALAEYAFTAILHFAKAVPRIMKQQQERRWEPFTVTRVEGQTVGIVGYGAIGQAIARIAEAFRMEVFATRHRMAGGGPLVPLDDLLRRSDYVVVSAPLTDETRGLIGDAQIRSMKRDGVLIDIGRGPIVDDGALVAALREKRIRAAALDVFDTEPLPSGHPLWSLDNVLLSPHCADHTDDSLRRAMTFFLENLTRFRTGETLLNVVDKQTRY